MGVSRSATVVCAYLIAAMEMTPDEALAAVKKKREIVNPNIGFMFQLDDYAMGLHGGEVGRRLRSGRTRPFVG